MMSTTTNDDAVFVAERLGVPCSCDNGRFYINSPVQITTVTCSQCKGTGYVWPLRQKCTELCDKEDALDCTRCENRGWFPATDYDLVEAAILAKGWYLSIDQYYNGNTVRVVDKWHYRLGTSVVSTQGLRGMSAIFQATRRAVEAKDAENEIRDT